MISGTKFQSFNHSIWGPQDFSDRRMSTGASLSWSSQNEKRGIFPCRYGQPRHIDDGLAAVGLAPKKAGRRDGGHRYAANSGDGNQNAAVELSRSSQSGNNSGMLRASHESRELSRISGSGGQAPTPLNAGEDRLMRLLLRFSRERRSDVVETGSPVAAELPC